VAVDILTPLLVGVVSAVLLIVPVAFRVGFVLIVIPLAGAFDVLARSSPQGTVEGLGILVRLELVPVALGIAHGTPIGKKLDRWSHPSN
jgi:hypothetical protein